MRHGYLIMGHGERKVLGELIRRIDDPRNDIYVHLDRKAPFERAEYEPKQANIHYLTERIDAAWGDFSLVEIEMALLKEALAHGEYEYLHLVSGVDLPVKSQDTIHAECEANPERLYIGYAKNVGKGELEWRSQHRFLFPRRFRSRNILIRGVRKIAARMESLCGKRRCELEMRKGAQWWSITGEFARYLIGKEDYIRENFKGTYCADEMVVQTLCWNSDYSGDVYRMDDEFRGCRRYIPWENGELRELRGEDFERMRGEEYWFARKFSERDIKARGY